MKYVCLFLLGATCFCGKLAAGPNPGTLSLWYDRPASRWEEALPLGNGRLGVMVYGGCGREELQLNEETIWAGGPHNNVNPAAREALPEVRRLIFEGRYKEAFDLCDENFSLHASHGMPYQTFRGIGTFRIFTGIWIWLRPRLRSVTPSMGYVISGRCLLLFPIRWRSCG